jgi:RNA polymerase sigma-70 factor (ECF subfamily)
MMEMDDRQLVQECLKGSKNAFEQLVDKYHKIIFNLAYRMTGQSDDAEDITQTVFIKIYDKLEIYNPKYQFYSWLYRIAVNESLNFLKAKRKYREVDSDMLSSEKNPEERCMDNELGLRVQAAIMELEPRYRILILLNHFRYCSYKEIAQTLDIPEKTVKSRLYTARQLLKDIFLKKDPL